MQAFPTVTLVFPHQLLQDHPAIQPHVPVVLIEEYLFFDQYKFHLQKLMLHRASMKTYGDWLVQKGIPVIYIEANDERSDIRKMIAWLAAQNCRKLQYADVTDDWLQRRIARASKKHGITTTVHDTPYFLNTMKDANAYFNGKKTYFQTAFYIDQRKQRSILVDGMGEPAGDRWSYDADNRSRFPQKETVPRLGFPHESDVVIEARKYVEKSYPHNYGSTEVFIYPTDFESAEKWLDEFLEHRFHKFGVYEDAMVANQHFLYHSVLSPLLNIGLLLPQQVIDKALAAAGKYKVPLNSLEGFVRQIMGWREFIRIVYEREGRKQRTKNYWGFSRKIPKSFWTGTTGIVPVDSVIKKVLEIGYCHHIERLMVMGNFMVLCEFDPNDVYRWFMEMFVDAYDWVMVPNVYGMTQFADGGLMTTKPYISGSNYILKMSDYKKGAWCETWDGMFWRFMHVNRHFFETNPRLGMLLKTFDKMPADKKTFHLENAEKFLGALDKANIDIA